MNKEFVTYEQALALKELGFDEPCLKFYAEGKLILGINADNGDTNSKLNQYNELFVSAPLKQQAFRFFRDRYNLEYQIVKSANGNYSVVIHKNTQEYLDSIVGLTHACLDEIVDLYSYEEAESACIDKLIEICKK